KLRRVDRAVEKTLGGDDQPVLAPVEAEQAAQLLSRGGIPQPRGPVPRPGEDALAVRAPRHRRDSIAVAGEGPELLAALGVPQDGRPVLRRGEGPLAVGAEGHGINPAGMSLQGLELLSAPAVPDDSGLVPRP